ncbi:MAG: bifunctional glutamate N-acetyltransferase/amino-acid acetyltransferase ArgJ [Chloroflexota bacterium]
MTTDYSVAGFDAVGVASGIKKDGALDVTLIASRTPCKAAATFTKNAFPAAPVLHGRRLLEFNPEQVHGVVVNSGNANACTGTVGDANTKLTAEEVEKQLGASDNSMFVMSTGVIGVQLPMDALLGGIPDAVQKLGSTSEHWELAAKGIMTTDLVHKIATRSLTLGDSDIKLTGISKGSGMIHPNMATMLGTVVTDINMSQPLLQAALSYAVDRSFNCITVDGDTSTNDTMILLANGAAGNAEITDADSADFAEFQATLTDICIELAQAIVHDGEGATRFVTIQVNGAVSDEEAHLAASTVATSPLCKTAFFGGDANWGRILAAAGRSGAQIDASKCALFINGGADANTRSGELQIVDQGMPLDYLEGDAAAIYAQAEIDARIELGLGEGTATVWTCDFSYEYVKINGEYRT